MREIKQGAWACQPVPAPFEPTEEALITWLSGQAGYRFALVHADDGVIWGRCDGGVWRWSSGVVENSPPLRALTLQQIRLFGDTGEVFVWRAAQGFAGRVISDDQGVPIEYFDESVLLWGKENTEPDKALPGFQPRKHGAEGLRHAPPTEIAAAGRCTLRSYINDDENGCAYVVASRLVA